MPIKTYLILLLHYWKVRLTGTFADFKSCNRDIIDRHDFAPVDTLSLSLSLSCGSLRFITFLQTCVHEARSEAAGDECVTSLLKQNTVPATHYYSSSHTLHHIITMETSAFYRNKKQKSANTFCFDTNTVSGLELVYARINSRDVYSEDRISDGGGVWGFSLQIDRFFKGNTTTNARQGLNPTSGSHVQFCRSAIGQVAFLFSACRRRCRHDLPNAPCVYNISTKQFDFPSKFQPFSSSYVTNTFRTNLA